ncbi:MAG: tetratricopeptide repeat protein, partial [Kiritimatiellaeota bacterium]|nr:tetratricopeptide repeat protein [Kiritimatiellota bacterium]
MQSTITQATCDAEFPRLGTGGHRFFQALENLPASGGNLRQLFSKVWKCAGGWTLPAACALLCWCTPSLRAADMFEQPEYNRVEAEPVERFHATPAEEEAALRRRETDITASARSDLLEALADFKAARWSVVIPKMEALIETDPTVMPAWDLLGNAYWRAGRRDDAVKLWNRLRTIRPDYPPVYNWLGRAYMMENNLANARATFAQGLALSAPLHDEDLNYARVLRWSGNLEESSRLMRPLVKANPNRLDMARELASALLSNREYDEALPLWQKLLTAEPTNLLFKAKTAVALLHTGKPAEAAVAAEEVLAADPAQMDALGIMADQAQFHSAEPANALPILLHMVTLTEKQVRKRQLTLRYVNLFSRLQSTDPEHYLMDRPAGLLGQLIEKDPFDADVRLALGEALVMCQNYAAAREQFNWVLEHLN